MNEGSEKMMSVWHANMVRRNKLIVAQLDT